MLTLTDFTHTSGVPLLTWHPCLPCLVLIWCWLFQPPSPRPSLTSAKTAPQIYYTMLSSYFYQVFFYNIQQKAILIYVIHNTSYILKSVQYDYFIFSWLKVRLNWSWFIIHVEVLNFGLSRTFSRQVKKIKIIGIINWSVAFK